jgi:hypothetical protein
MVQTDISSIVYVGNNSTTAAYPVPFYFFTEADLVVTVKDALGVEELQILNTDYMITGEGDPNGGALVMAWAVPSTSFVSIVRAIAATQLTSYEEADAFPAKSHERALDKLTMLVQQALRVTGGGDPENLAQAFRLSEASVGINAVARVDDSILGIDAMGNAVLRTAGGMLSWLGQVGTVWADTPTRLNTRGAYRGQLGVQLDNFTIYIADSTTPGDWLPFLLGTGIVGATNGVPHLLTPPAGDLVGTDQSQTLYNKTLESPTIHTPTGLTKNDVGLSQVDNTSDLNKPLSSATGAALAFKQDKTEKGISNGYPSLDGGGKIPTTQLPDSVVGASQYKGTWNASTNSPSITTGSAPGKTGWYYSVAVAGTTTVDGISSWAVGDQIISNGTVWQKIPNVSAVSSVNSKTGAVVLVPADISLGNVDNTSDATKNAAAVTLTNKTINGANNTLTVRLDADVANNLPVNRLNNGTGASGTTWWCGDNSWKQPPGTGDVSGPIGSADGELCLYSGTTGKVIRRFSGTAGFAKAGTTGLLTTVTKIHGADLDPDVISAQPVKAAPAIQDSYLIYDFSTGLLKSTPATSVSKLPRGYLSGCITSNNTTDTANDIDVAAGVCRSDDDTGDIIISAVITKRLDAPWVAGTNQGGRDTGAISDATWHMFAIRNPTTNVSDVLFSLSLSPTMPSGFTQKRRIASIIRRGAGGIIPFRQLGDYFQIVSPITDQNNPFTPVGVTATLALGNVPTGLKFFAHVVVQASTTGGAAQIIIRDPDQGNPGQNNLWTPSTANGVLSYTASFWTNTTAQLFYAFVAGSGTATIATSVLGYTDPRGKQD